MIGMAAVVSNGEVINRIVVELDEDGKTDFEMENLEIVVIPDDSPVGAGYTYNNKQFTAPPEPDESE